MLRSLAERREMLTAASTGRQLKPLWQVLLSPVYCFAYSLISGFAMAVPLTAAMLLGGGAASFMLGDGMMIVSCSCTAVSSAALILFARFVEKRPLRSLGFTKKRMLSDYLLGLLAGAVLISLALGICVVTGASEFTSFNTVSPLFIIATFASFLIQGASEEILCRGFIMTSIGGKGSVLFALLFNSVCFSLMHLSNSGVSALALINIFLFGVLESIIVLRFESIWFACAVHSMWNFVQGNIFGVLVSGNNTQQSVMTFSPTGSALMNGGAFGLEGGLGVTISLALGIAAALLLKNRKSADKAALC